MTTRKIKISQLTELTSASLNTTLVGVDNGVTYKMELDTLADAITSIVNTSDRSRISALEAETGSYLTSLEGSISSSDQLTSSFDTRYTLSGSVQPLPDGLISGSSQITIGDTTGFTEFSSSLSASIALGTNEQDLSNLATTGSNTFIGDQTITGSVSIDGGLRTNDYQISLGSNTQVDGYAVAIGADTQADSYSVSIGAFAAKKNVTNSTSYTVAIGAFAQQNANPGDQTGTGAIAIGTLAGDSNQGTNAVALGRYAGRNDQAARSIVINATGGDLENTTSDSLVIKPIRNNDGPSILMYDSVSGEITHTLNNLISGSSQLTSSFDTRYTLSGSVQPLPDGLISGSSQLTSSYDTRYALSSSLSSISSSFDSRFDGLVTTGSNTFSGSQVFSGSMTVTSGQVIASTITNNSSSLFLQSGSNLYVQNDGVVEITGSLRVSGLTSFVAGGGDEGGEIQFGIPTTNTTLQNRVTVDVYQNRLRIFEGSNDAKGVYIDLSKPTTGNNNEITYKASGIVNAGTFVTLDNIKATVTTSGQRGLSLATVSGTISINMAGNYAGAGVGVGGSSGTASITTSESTSLFGWGFTAQGDFANYIITDTTNSRAYRIIIQIGNSFNNNLVSIERLH